jgi:hypothetical protein
MNPKDVAETPRCDSVAFEVWTKEWGNMVVVPADDANALERELSEATKERDQWKEKALRNGLDCAAAIEQKDQWKAMAVQFSEASNDVLWDKAITRFREMTPPK